MTAQWRLVRLGDVLVPNRDAVRVQADASYPNFGIYSFGRGLFAKPPIEGAATSAPVLYRARVGQFVYSRLFAFEGAYGVVPPALDGTFVSNEFPLFDSDEASVDPRFLAYCVGRPSEWCAIAEAAIGVGHRRQRVQPEALLDYHVRLPPVAEQRRLVALVEELCALVRAARAERDGASEETRAVVVSMAHRHDLEDEDKAALRWRKVPLGTCIRLVDDSHPVIGGCAYPNVGMFSFGRGLFRKPPIDGAATSAQTLRRVRTGQFIYSRLFAFEGAYGIVTEPFDGSYVSGEYPTFECDRNQVRPEFLAAYFRAPSAWQAVARGSKGIGYRRQRVQPAIILAHEVWLPPLDWQDHLADVNTESDAATRLQAETAAELDALLPAVLDRAFKGEL